MLFGNKSCLCVTSFTVFDSIEELRTTRCYTDGEGSEPSQKDFDTVKWTDLAISKMKGEKELCPFGNQDMAF